MNHDTISRQLVHQGERIALYHVELPAGNGKTQIKEFVAHPGAVVILPVVSEDHVCLIRNWRYSAGKTLWELPAGTLEPGEKTLTAAQRELEEETGYHAEDWRLLSEFWVSPGVYSEKMWLYVAQGLTPGPQQLDATERIEPVVMPWSQAIQMAL